MSLETKQRKLVRSQVGKIEHIMRPFMFASCESSSNGNTYALQYMGSIAGKSLSFNFLNSLASRFNAYAKAHREASSDVARQANYPNPSEAYTTISLLTELQRLVDIPYAAESSNIIFNAKNALNDFKLKLRRNTNEFRVLQTKKLGDDAISPFFRAKHAELTEEDINFLLSEFDKTDIEYRYRAALVGLSGKNWKNADMTKEEKAIIDKIKNNYTDDEPEKYMKAIRFAVKKHKYMSSDDYQRAGRIPNKHRSTIFVNDMAQRSMDFSALSSRDIRQIQESYLKITEVLEADYLVDSLSHLSKPKAA